MMSAVGGLMLGIAVLHMLPHGILECHSLQWGMGGLMAGLLTTFFLMRLFHFHEHAPVESEYPGTADSDHQHGGHLHCEHDHDHQQTSHQPEEAPMRWLGVLLGLSVHTFLDGIALAAGVAVAASHQDSSNWLMGFSVFLGILLHKPLDALSITFVMRASKWPVSTISIVNLGYALMCPIGVIIFYTSYNELDASKHLLIGLALCFSAGVFLCISLADILPEIQFHSHDKIKLSIAMLAGVLVAWMLGLLEPESMHQHTLGE